MTIAEAVVWELLRNRKLGFKIVRQKPIVITYFEKKKVFVADFYCSEAKVVIEIDGKVHESEAEYDKVRSALINQNGIEVIRFSNEDVFNNPELIAQTLKQYLTKRLCTYYVSPLHRMERG